jgi:hypothetical protein
MKRLNVLTVVRLVSIAILVGLVVCLSGSSAMAADDARSPAQRPAPLSGSAVPPSCMGRTDVAALDEYCGALPDAADRRRPAPRLEHTLPKKLVERLEMAGPLGELLLALPTAAPRSSLGTSFAGLHADNLLRSGRLGARKKPPTNPVEAAVRAVTDGAMDASFGSVLLLSTVGLAGTAWVRFRRRRTF